MNINFLKSPKSCGSARGYTLVEVMVSVGVLAVMLAALYPAFALGFSSIKTTREDARATQIVTQKLEGFRLITWDNQNVCPSTFVDYYNPADTNGAKGAVYYGTITIQTNGTAALNTVVPAACTYQSQIRLITIGVTWTNNINNNTAIPHQRKMQTLSAFNGLQNYLFGQY
jgi:prepilin-type N-terminal cleavage/methylation domain-containing protein